MNVAVEGVVVGVRSAISVVFEDVEQSVAGQTEALGSNPSVLVKVLKLPAKTVASEQICSTHSTSLYRTLGYDIKKNRFWFLWRAWSGCWRS